MKSILLAKKHKGGWVILADEDTPHSAQVQTWNEIMASHPIHDTYSNVRLLRVDVDSEIKRSREFVTADQAKKDADEEKRYQASLDQASEDAVKRYKLQEDNTRADEEKKRAERVAEINKLHDSHRNQFSPTAKPKAAQ